MKVREFIKQLLDRDLDAEIFMYDRLSDFFVEPLISSTSDGIELTVGGISQSPAETRRKRVRKILGGQE